MATDFKRLWAKAGENVVKMHGCKRHRFADETAQPFQRMYCLECGCEMGLRNVNDYIRGYIAAGGDPQDIWPQWPSPPQSPA